MIFTSGYSMKDLIEIMARLRGENGCPWDKAQTHETLKPFLLEEAYEVIDAIDGGDPGELSEELGDLLLQIVFHSRIAEENGRFCFDDVVDGICKKMVRRHPHIFGDLKVSGAADVLKNWEDIKKEEKEVNSYAETMDKVPEIFPALMRAYKVQEKAARVGFDWENVEGALEKVYEELKELKEVYKSNNSDKIREEIGDLLFAVVNVARFLSVNPELALREATRKFIRRFKYVEEAASKIDKNLQEMSLEDMDRLWNEGKNKEKKL
ncbi:tetrapyrrole methylase family protein/MazG family protein [Thermosediminibacter litoriperuensis]|uniref:Tetrapyrrole methylase family protein/MazG family protein n=2 Tax=Thermosediminibacter litoriperuensis TaxID=291989 RepID=A0A5S5AJ75_9FIRM|nr:nucleoside triphosphate pyrophosphohydrolase [Thermosediminibacter litoriperuensis]TYP50869.1 tetrapyrrole methylase family protein/MazG family protein [Thermosediminibacter litoriperuensis]